MDAYKGLWSPHGSKPGILAPAKFESGNAG